MRLPAIRFAAFSAAALLAACGGGAGGAAPSTASRTAGGTAAVTLRVDVPQTGTAANARRPAYISQATQSLAVAVLNSTVPIASTSVNLTAASSACQTATVDGAARLACTVTFDVPIAAGGTYDVATATYDRAQTQPCAIYGNPACAGNVLSAALTSATLQRNAANTIALVLGGLPAAFTVTPAANGGISGSVAGLTLAGPARQTVVVQALDAAGNTIVGAGAPAIAMSANASALTAAGTGNNSFTLQAATTGGVVTPGTVPLTLTATPVNSPAQPYTQTVNVTIAHSVVFVSDNGSVHKFFDGGTSEATPPISVAAGSPREIAVASNGDLFVGTHTSPNGFVYACTAASNWSACSQIVTSSQPFIEGVALEASGNLWVTANGNVIIEYLAGSWSVGTTLTTAIPTLRGLSFDPSGNLWTADQSTNTLYGFVPPNAAPFATIATGLNAPIQTATDASGNVWVANAGGTVTEFTPPVASGASPALSFAGIANPQGVAIDAAGTAWIAESNPTNAVAECPAPIGTASCTPFNVANPVWIAAFPASISEP